MTPDSIRLLTGAAPAAVGAAALALGAFSAQASGPLSWKWPAQPDELMERVVALRQAPAGRVRTAISVAFVALVLGAGALTAYAAEPSAPAQLPKEVVGVVGSGDRLSLQVKSADGGVVRTLKVGDVYRDGWKLESLTDTAATLGKAGQTIKVGLNPQGVVAAPVLPAEAPSLVLTADERAALQKLIAQGAWDGKTAKNGLTLAQTQREYAYMARITAANDRKCPPPQTFPPACRLSQDDVWSLLGDAGYRDNASLEADELAARIADEQAHPGPLVKSGPAFGPSTYYVPPGGNEVSIITQQGIDVRGTWKYVSDGQGGRTAIRTSTNVTDSIYDGLLGTLRARAAGDRSQ